MGRGKKFENGGGKGRDGGGGRIYDIRMMVAEFRPGIGASVFVFFSGGAGNRGPRFFRFAIHAAGDEKTRALRVSAPGYCEFRQAVLGAGGAYRHGFLLRVLRPVIFFLAGALTRPAGGIGRNPRRLGKSRGNGMGQRHFSTWIGSFFGPEKRIRTFARVGFAVCVAESKNRGWGGGGAGGRGLFLVGFSTGKNDLGQGNGFGQAGAT